MNSECIFRSSFCSFVGERMRYYRPYLGGKHLSDRAPKSKIIIYRVTIQLVLNFLLTLIWNMRISPSHYFKTQLSHQCQREVLNNLMCHPVATHAHTIFHALDTFWAYQEPKGIGLWATAFIPAFAHVLFTGTRFQATTWLRINYTFDLIKSFNKIVVEVLAVPF